MELRELLRQNWRRAMPVRAGRRRGVRRRPRSEDELAALRRVNYRVARRAFSTWILREGPKAYRLVSGGGG
ncbi:MAG: hypothetical protein RMM30_03915 [Armatimonadota bacterium]|nr:hypothetical protein [Armatimonadota bacterium]MDW8155714.1 hypothetical protein [Armatimonadota bacterium]